MAARNGTPQATGDDGVAPPPAPHDRPIGATHRPLRHAVLEELRRRIVAGEWAQGERLFEDQIAADLQVSRNPLREALQALQGEGFVELEPRRGARVASVSARRARELFEVREVLEGLAASLAAHHRTEPQLDEMRAVVELGSHTALAGPLGELPALNTRFHQLLAAAAGNEMLADTIERLRHIIEWVYSQRIAQRAPQSWEEHREIVEAIAGGDAPTAERVARSHIAEARAAYLGRTMAD